MAALTTLRFRNCESASPLTKSPLKSYSLNPSILVNFLRGCECLITLIIQLNKIQKNRLNSLIGNKQANHIRKKNHFKDNTYSIKLKL